MVAPLRDPFTVRRGRPKGSKNLPKKPSFVPTEKEDLVKGEKTRKIRQLFTIPRAERMRQGLPVTHPEIAEFVGCALQTVEHVSMKMGKAGELPGTEANVQRDQEKDFRIVYLSMYNKATKDGDVRAAELLFKTMGRLVDKKEITHKLDGSFFARARREATKQLEREAVVQASGGVGEVRAELQVLPDNLLLSSGQGEGSDDSLRDVAPSEDIRGPASQ